MAIPSAQHLVVPTLVLFLVFFVTPLPAQDTDTALPECTSVADDPDGDGFGWVVLTQSSCRVTDNTSAAPQRVNRETGQPVLLERAYWDANADFADRSLHCRQFEWNDGEGQYQSSSQNWFRFIALPEQPPWIADYFSLGSADDLQNLNPLNRVSLQWSVDFGIFSSRDHLFFRDDFPATYTPWIERFTTDTDQMGVRFWDRSPDQSQSNVEFSQCVDISGEPFGPTGRWDQPATNLPSAYDETPLYFRGEEEPLPDLTNRETGQPVQFESAYWEFQSDLSHRSVSCAHIEWDDSTGTYHQARFNPGFTDIVRYHPRLLGGASDEGWAWWSFDGRNFADGWGVDGGTFSTPGRFANSMWYEPIVNNQGVLGVRYWGTPDDDPEHRSTYFINCYATERPERGLVSSSSLVNRFRPSVEVLPADMTPEPEVTPPATDGPEDQGNGVSEGDASDGDGGGESTAAPSAETSSPVDGGAGGFALLLLVPMAVVRRKIR